MDLKWSKFRRYSGPVIKGKDSILKPWARREAFHVDRAYWLTTMVESGGKLGAVMMADGTAVTIGLDQHVAVMPKNLFSQGGAWKLLRRLETVDGDVSFKTAVQYLWDALAEVGWYISQDGKLRFANHFVDTSKRDGVWTYKPGEKVPGDLVRNELTPMGGRVPEDGPRWEQAVRWARLFHKVTAHPDGEHAQIEFGKEHLVDRTHDRSWFLNRAYLGQEVSAIQVDKDGWTPALDLAMCMFQSHMVNAPAIARKRMEMVYKTMAPVQKCDDTFAKKLIKAMGNCRYGRWDDDIKYGRYQRTRSIARASSLWPRSLFDGKKAIMPRNLPG